MVVYDLYAKFYESLDTILVFQPFTNRPSKSPEFECFGILNVLAILTGVNKGRYVTLKYFNILKKVSRKHRLCIYCKLQNCKVCKRNKKGKCNGPLF